MNTIEVDDDVYAKLQQLAQPFVDTPNSVLRRVLQLNEEKPMAKHHKAFKAPTRMKAPSQTRDTDEFVRSHLEKSFGGGFRKRAPYRMMFESGEKLVYFQNFNSADVDTLWFRLRGDSLKDLRTSRKEAIVCFTNPSKDLAFAVPFGVIQEGIERAKWNRPDLEVNIEYPSWIWRELGFSIRPYRLPPLAQ